jgi:hypothetical protein
LNMAQPIPIDPTDNLTVEISLPRPQARVSRGDRRRDPRFPTNSSALLRSLNPLGPNRIRAKVLDISKNGMRLRVDTQLHPGMIVHIFLGKTMVIGEIRYCKAVGDGFEHGVAVQDTFLETSERRDNLVS